MSFPDTVEAITIPHVSCSANVSVNVTVDAGISIDWGHRGDREDDTPFPKSQSRRCRYQGPR